MSLFLLIVAFVTTGLCTTTNKALIAWGLGEHIQLYTLAFYGAPLVLGLMGMRIRRGKVGADDRRVGFVMGAFGAISTICFLLALEHTSAIVAFPVRSVASLLLTCLISVAAWRERLSRVQWVAVGISIVAIWLIY